MNATAMTHAQAHTGGPAGDDHDQVLTFLVAGELYGVPILAVQEIRGWERTTVLPRSLDHVSGVINLRGNVVPVLEVRRRFALEHRAPDAETVLIVVQVMRNGAVTTVGLVVDAVSDVIEIDRGNVRPAPAVCGEQARDFVRGIAPVEQRMLLLLDLGALVGDVHAIA
jgi:purine-binding chemotaxis protein CheW